MVPGSVLEDMLKDAGNCACAVWPLATHQRRSSFTGSLAEVNGKHCCMLLCPKVRGGKFVGKVPVAVLHGHFVHAISPSMIEIAHRAHPR